VARLDIPLRRPTRGVGRFRRKPVSNAVYQRLGYHPVCDYVDCVLVEQ
jgi:hypothetical protein